MVAGSHIHTNSIAAMCFIAALEDAASVESSGKHVHAGVMQQEVHCIAAAQPHASGLASCCQPLPAVAQQLDPLQPGVDHVLRQPNSHVTSPQPVRSTARPLTPRQGHVQLQPRFDPGMPHVSSP